MYKVHTVDGIKEMYFNVVTSGLLLCVVIYLGLKYIT